LLHLVGSSVLLLTIHRQEAVTVYAACGIYSAENIKIT